MLPTLAATAGWTRISEDDFCPLFHEIVAVEPAEDPDAGPELVAEVWQGFMAGRTPVQDVLGLVAP